MPIVGNVLSFETQKVWLLHQVIDGNQLPVPEVVCETENDVDLYLAKRFMAGASTVTWGTPAEDGSKTSLTAINRGTAVITFFAYPIEYVASGV